MPQAGLSVAGLDSFTRTVGEEGEGGGLTWAYAAAGVAPEAHTRPGRQRGPLRRIDPPPPLGSLGILFCSLSVHTGSSFTFSQAVSGMCLLHAGTQAGSAPSLVSCYCHSWCKRTLASSVKICNLAQRLTSLTFFFFFNHCQTQRPPHLQLFWACQTFLLISSSQPRSHSLNIKETFLWGRRGSWVPTSQFLSPIFEVLGDNVSRCWARRGCKSGPANGAVPSALFPGQPRRCSCWGGCFPGGGGGEAAALTLPTWARLGVSCTASPCQSPPVHWAGVHANQRFCTRSKKKKPRRQVKIFHFKVFGCFLKYPLIPSAGFRFLAVNDKKLLPFTTSDLWKILWLDLWPHERSDDLGTAVECFLLTPFHFLIWKRSNVYARVTVGSG